MRTQLKTLADTLPAEAQGEVAAQELRLDQLDANLEADERTIMGKRHDG